MNINLSQRVQQVKASPTLALTAQVLALKAQGKDILSLGAGEPDFDTPAHIKTAAIQAIDDNFTRYTAVDGIPELKQAIVDKLKRDNGLTYQTDQILVSTGAKQSIYNVAQALLNPGDEVIMPAPYWVSYPDMMLLAGAKPVIINTTIDQSYKITAAQLEQALTDKTKLFMINSPSNPSGIAYTSKELKQLAEVLLNHPQVMILSDDIYEHIWWHKEPFANIASVCPELSDRILVINGVSKAYAMTGWRIGYAAGNKTIIAAMKKIQSQSTSNPNSIAQKAAAAAISGDQKPVADMLVAYKQRHDMVYQRLAAMKGVNVIPADGTFYIFPDISEILNRSTLKDDIEFAGSLLEQTGVALVPGSAFGNPNNIRISFATSMEILTEALDRIEAYIHKI